MPEGLNKITTNEEARCPHCGYKQSQVMLHLYRICHRIHCRREVIPANALKLPSLDKEGRARLIILAAAYGHTNDPFQAIIVTDKLQSLIIVHPRRPDVLNIAKTVDLRTLFGDPCKDSKKVLKIRYLMFGVRGEIELRESTPGFLAQDFIMQCPKEARLLTIFDATYGPQGSGTYDAAGLLNVKEKICGLADLGGGSFVSIPHTFPLADLFGMPCSADRRKHLTIRYEIEGRSDRIQRFDFDHHLNAPLEIKAAVPRLEPLILINSAFYGLTREMIKARAKEIQHELQSIYRVQASKAAGLELTQKQQQTLSKAVLLENELETAIQQGPNCYDVTFEVQRRVEAAGGDLISFKRDDKEDLNVLFGKNPCPGLPKELRIKYTSIGNDADRTTTSEELTTRGYQRNIIKNFDGELGIPVVDDPGTGAGLIQTDAKVTSQKAFPLLDVIVAKYGIPSNPLKMKDITKDVRRLVLQQGGWQLVIPVEQDLEELFGKTYVQGRKELIVSYMLRGIVGVMRVDEVKGHLRSSLALGYPTVIEYEEEDVDALAKKIKALEDEKKLDMNDLKARLETVRGYENGAKEEIKRHPPTAVHLYCKTIKKGPKNHQSATATSLAVQKGQILSGRLHLSQKEKARNRDGNKFNELTITDSAEAETRSSSLDSDDKERDEAEEGLYCTYNTRNKLKVGTSSNNKGLMTIEVTQLIDRDKEYTISNTATSSKKKELVGQEEEVGEEEEVK